MKILIILLLIPFLAISQATYKSSLPPRLTKAQKDAITSGVEGLVVHQTDSTIFKPGYYKQGTIVVDANGVKWKAKKSVTAKTSPKASAYWELVKAPALSLDSLERRLNQLEAETFILRIAQQGYSILNIKGDKSGAYIRTIVPGKGIKITQTDSTIIISQ